MHVNVDHNTKTQTALRLYVVFQSSSASFHYYQCADQLIVIQYTNFNLDVLNKDAFKFQIQRINIIKVMTI